MSYPQLAKTITAAGPSSEYGTQPAEGALNDEREMASYFLS